MTKRSDVKVKDKVRSKELRERLE